MNSFINQCIVCFSHVQRVASFWQTRAGGTPSVGFGTRWLAALIGFSLFGIVFPNALRVLARWLLDVSYQAYKNEKSERGYYCA